MASAATAIAASRPAAMLADANQSRSPAMRSFLPSAIIFFIASISFLFYPLTHRPGVNRKASVLETEASRRVEMDYSAAYRLNRADTRAKRR
jgi:hypothetical protein